MGIPALKHPFPENLPDGYRKLSPDESVHFNDLLWNPIKGTWVKARGWVDEDKTEKAREFRFVASKR